MTGRNTALRRPTARFSRRRLDERTLPTARPGGRLEPCVGPWQLPLPAGAKDCHDWEKMQSSAAQPTFRLRQTRYVSELQASENLIQYGLSVPQL